MKATLARPRVSIKAVQDWKRQLNEIADDVERWAKEENWSFLRESKRLYESGLGSYTAPVLRVRAPQGEIWIDTTAMLVAGGPQGRVDIYGFPAQDRVTMLRYGNGWKIIDDSGRSLRRPWSKKTLAYIIDLLCRIGNP